MGSGLTTTKMFCSACNVKIICIILYGNYYTYVPLLRIIHPAFEFIQIKLPILVKRNPFWIQYWLLVWLRKAFKKMVKRKSKQPLLVEFSFPGLLAQYSN